MTSGGGAAQDGGGGPRVAAAAGRPPCKTRRRRHTSATRVFTPVCCTNRLACKDKLHNAVTVNFLSDCTLYCGFIHSLYFSTFVQIKQGSRCYTTTTNDKSTPQLQPSQPKSSSTDTYKHIRHSRINMYVDDSIHYCSTVWTQHLMQSFSP